MRIEFQNNHIYTNITVAVGNSERKFDALIDTGSTQTALPLEQCQSLGLQSNATCETETANGKALLPIFTVNIRVGDRQFNSVQIKGLPVNTVLLGIDLLQKYRFKIDWLAQPQTASAEY
jgi:predicted aspartyl protease